MAAIIQSVGHGVLSVFACLRSVLKATILVGWIYFLIMGALFAASNSASKFVLNLFEGGILLGYSAYAPARNASDSPQEQLRQYLRKYRENTPPIASVLSSVITLPSWDVRVIQPRFDPSVESPEHLANGDEWRREQYEELFRRVENRLHALAIDSSRDAKTASISTDVVPDAFKDASESEAFPLPQEAVNWILAERERIASRTARSRLIDTFLLLMVLGAFGSLIFLTRDFIDPAKTTPLAAYFFRPVLGIFLAIAMFIVDVGAHFVFSSADLLEIRHETLYLLALAAGLLSEQTYGVVERRAGGALTRLRGKASDDAESTDRDNFKSQHAAMHRSAQGSDTDERPPA